MKANDTFEDQILREEYCIRCEQIIPLDGLCDCKEDPERDLIKGLKGLKTNNVSTVDGMRRLVERKELPERLILGRLIRE